jgi:hypothetical protein
VRRVFPLIHERYCAAVAPHPRTARLAKAIQRLAHTLFKTARLDRQQIEAILAPPSVVVPRAMPRRPGDEPEVYRRCDGYFR